MASTSETGHAKNVANSQKITETIDNDFAKSLEEHEDEFRKILGVI